MLEISVYMTKNVPVTGTKKKKLNYMEKRKNMKDNKTSQKYINIKRIDKNEKNCSILEGTIQKITNNKSFALKERQYLITIINQKISKKFINHLNIIGAQYLIISCENQLNIITNKVSEKKYMSVDEMIIIMHDYISN